MKRASTWLGPGALPSALSSTDRKSCMEYCWTRAQAHFRDPGHVAAQNRLNAGTVDRALVVQFPPEGANREHHVVGLCEERLGVGDPHVPEARWAWSLHLDGIWHGLALLGDVLGVAAPEVFDGALAVGRHECAQVAVLLLEGGCLPLQLLLQLALCGWAESGRCTLQLRRQSECCLGVDAVPGRVFLVRCWRARCQGVIAKDRRL